LSKIALSGNPSGTGTLTIAAPNTNSDATINLPTVTGGEFIVSDASGNVGIGTSDPQGTLHVTKNHGSQPVPFGSEPQVVVGGAQGGAGAQGYMGGLWFASADGGSDFGKAAGIVGNSLSDFSATSRAGHLEFYTTPSGSITPVERMRIASDGAQSSVIPGGSTLYPEFKCRAWVNFNGSVATPSIFASGNVSSVAKIGTGRYTVNFTTAMPDASYAGAGSAIGQSDAAGSVNISSHTSETTKTTSACSFRVTNNNGDLRDVNNASFFVIR
jgi:hypothetical protein